MNKKYFENTSDIAIFVGGKLLQPGEGREFNADDLPPEHQLAPALPAAEAPTLAEQVALLLQESVKTIAASLGNLNDDTLDMMTALEGALEKPRTSLLTAIADERIARADVALKSDTL